MRELLTTALGALLGSTAGLLTALQVWRIQRAGDFRLRQLSEFYSPMAGCVKRIRAHIAFDQRIWPEYEEAWKKTVAKYGSHIPDSIDEDSKRFRKRVDYANDQNQKQIIPLYRQMLERFAENYWLAAPQTRDYYQDFFEFVEIWNMQEQDVLAFELRERIRPDMKQVGAFFDHLEAMVTRLQGQVSRGGR
jgi:hypothetical protein